MLARATPGPTLRFTAALMMLGTLGACDVTTEADRDTFAVSFATDPAPAASDPAEITVTGSSASVARVAARRGSTRVPTGWRGWRCSASKAGIVVRFDTARVRSTRSVAHVLPDVSTTQASEGSATRNEDQ